MPSHFEHLPTELLHAIAAALKRYDANLAEDKKNVKNDSYG
jgi:hypothetical protein